MSRLTIRRMRRRSATILALATATAVALAGCSLVGPLTPSARYDSPGGRVDLPESGIALTFPDDWSTDLTPTTGSWGSTDVFDPGLRELVVPVVAAVPGHRHDRCVVSDIGGLVRAQSDWSTVDDVVAGYGREFAADRRWVGLKTRVVDLPAGRAGHIMRVVDGESESASSWFFTNADAWFVVECVNHTALSRDWHSIAETFEFLSAEE